MQEVIFNIKESKDEDIYVLYNLLLHSRHLMRCHVFLKKCLLRLGENQILLFPFKCCKPLVRNFRNLNKPKKTTSFYHKLALFEHKAISDIYNDSPCCADTNNQ